MSQLKVCIKCHKEKQLEDFYFHIAGGNLRADCKQCYKEKLKEKRDKTRLTSSSYIKKQNKLNLIKSGYHTCSKCNEIKELNNFRLRLQRNGKKIIDCTCKQCRFLNEKKWFNNNRQRALNTGRKWIKNNPEKVIWQRAKHRAECKNLDFNLELSDIIIPEFCPVFGTKLEKGTRKNKDNAPSLDRLIPELGYVKGNIIIMSHKANELKNNATINQLEKVIEFMRKNGCK